MSRYTLTYFSESKNREYMIEEMATKHVINARKKVLEDIKENPKTDTDWDPRELLVQYFTEELTDRAKAGDEAAMAFTSEQANAQ